MAEANQAIKAMATPKVPSNDSDAKLQSAICSSYHNSRGLNQGKKQNIIERKKSFMSDRPVSPMAGATTSLTMEAKRDERLCTSSKSTIFTARKGSENMVASDGSGDVKKQSSFLSCPSVIPSFSGMCNILRNKNNSKLALKRILVQVLLGLLVNHVAELTYFSMMACLRFGSMLKWDA